MPPTGFPRLTSATVCRNGLYAVNRFQQFTNESMCLPGTSWGWHGLDWVMLPWQRFASASWSSLQWRVRCCRPSSSQSPQSVHSPQPDDQRTEQTERMRAWDWKRETTHTFKSEKKPSNIWFMSAVWAFLNLHNKSSSRQLHQLSLVHRLPQKGSRK